MHDVDDVATPGSLPWSAGRSVIVSRDRFGCQLHILKSTREFSPLRPFAAGCCAESAAGSGSGRLEAADLQQVCHQADAHPEASCPAA